MRRIIIGMLAMLAIGAATAGSASAKMTVELRTARGPVIAGQELLLSSSNVYFSVGEIECSADARMIVGNANGPGSITGLSLHGNNPGEPCTSAFGAAGVAAQELPWSIAFRRPVVPVTMRTRARGTPANSAKTGPLACVRLTAFWRW